MDAATKALPGGVDTGLVNAGDDDTWQREVSEKGLENALLRLRKERAALAALSVAFEADGTHATIAWAPGELLPPPPTVEMIPFDPTDRFHRLKRETCHALSTGTLTLNEHPDVYLEFRVMLRCGRDSHPHISVDDPTTTPCWLRLVRAFDIWHTYVPLAYRGKGMGAVLCKVGFAYAATQGMPVIPTCTYVRDAFLRKHPEYVAALEEGEGPSGATRLATVAELRNKTDDELRQLCEARGHTEPRGGRQGMLHLLASL